MHLRLRAGRSRSRRGSQSYASKTASTRVCIGSCTRTSGVGYRRRRSARSPTSRSAPATTSPPRKTPGIRRRTAGFAKPFPRRTPPHPGSRRPPRPMRSRPLSSRSVAPSPPPLERGPRGRRRRATRSASSPPGPSSATHGSRGRVRTPRGRSCWRSLGPHASTTGAARRHRVRRGPPGEPARTTSVAKCSWPMSQLPAFHRAPISRIAGRRTDRTASSGPISPAARSGRLDGLPIEDEHGLHDVICEVVTGSGRAARAEEPHGLGGREAPRHEIAKVPQLFDLAFVVPAVAAAGPGGCREPVPALPGPDRRDGDPETLRHPRDGGFPPSRRPDLPEAMRRWYRRDREAMQRGARCMGSGAAPAAPYPPCGRNAHLRDRARRRPRMRRGRRPRARTRRLRWLAIVLLVAGGAAIAHAAFRLLS